MQEDACREYCTRKGYVVHAVYSDPLSSGKSMKDRPGIAQALTELKRGMILVAWKSNRILRNDEIMIALESSVRKRGAYIEVVEGHVAGDPESPMVKLFKKMQYILDQWDREQKAIETSIKMLARQARGERMSNELPFGNRIDPDNEDRFVQDDDEQEVLKMMMTFYREERSLQKVSDRLASLGHYNRRGNPWDRKSIGRILRREMEDYDECRRYGAC